MKKLKNCIILLFCMVISSSIVFAKTGDIIGKAVNTDIVAYINGLPIPSYNINGYTGIVAEDLEKYGFDVWYSDSERTLRIEYDIASPNEITADYIPPKNTKAIGSFAANIYETDIIARLFYGADRDEKSYDAGNRVILEVLSQTDDESIDVNVYNIGGKSIILMDDLEYYGNVTWYPEKRKICFDYVSPSYYKIWDLKIKRQEERDVSKDISDFAVEFKRTGNNKFDITEKNIQYLTDFTVTWDEERNLMFGFQLEMNVMDETEELHSMLNKMLNQDREGNKVQEGTDFVNEHIKVSVNGIYIPVTFVRGGGGNGHSDFYFYFDTSSLDETVKEFDDIQTIAIECK
ncbi:hypothetical protein [Clostridium sp. MD294]|uniref:hypothetical protein n=1 Tax=Clostridium sp. MD294 TaxID=97138 RepID=UPI0002CAB03E|nr:hypothetical protein [Clostridium sp. MD294]USF31121.1 hypothetical protein C820_002567 [Clostridium sp. MD294]